MLTRPEEPAPTGWAVRDLRLVVRRILDIAGDVHDRPVLVAVDGRSGGGKTTVADRIAAIVPGSAVVRTDDVAWEHSAFGWDDVLDAGVLQPLRRGEAVDLRPAAWDEHGREGSIAVPDGTFLVLVEGVGSSRASLAGSYDATLWVASDEAERRRRGIERDTALGRAPADAVAFWDRWDAEEIPFLAADRPWERADVVACGTPTQAGLAPGDDELVVVSRSGG